MITALPNGIRIYSKALLPVFKEAGHLNASILQDALKLCQPGISTYEVDQFIESEIYKHKAVPLFKGYNNFPYTTCISVNEIIVHGFPSKKVILKNEDIVTLDTGLRLGGLCSDNARTVIVGGHSKHSQVVTVAEEAFKSGLAQAYVGSTVGNISHAILKQVMSYKESNTNLYQAFHKFEGHGIGLELHEAPPIPNVGIKDTGPKLIAGMCFCIEPVIMYNSSKVIDYKDNNSGVLQFKTDNSLPTSHYENQIYLSADGPIILTY
jgi:methionyl aminopeptidase